MKKTLILVLPFIFIISIFGYASPIQENINIQTNTVKVFVKLDEAYSGKYVSMQIINPDKNIQDLLNGNGETLNWLDIEKLDNTGSCEFEFQMMGDTGIYTIRIGADELATPYEKTFMYYSPSEISTIWKDIQKAILENNSAYAQWLILNRSDLLQLDTKYYNLLDATKKEKVHNNILKQPIMQISDFGNRFLELSSIQILNSYDSFSDFESLFYKIKGESAKVADVLLEQKSEVEKQRILSAFMKGSYVSLADILQDYNNLLITSEMNIRVKMLWGDVYAHLVDAKDVLNIDFTSYNRLSEIGKSKAIKAMMNEEYTALTQIALKFNDTVSAQLKLESEEIKTNGGSGGGGGITSRPVVMDYVNITTEESSEKNGNSQLEFEDLSDVNWAVNSIKSLQKLGVVEGDFNHLFHPNNTITRAEFVKMVVCAFDIAYKDLQSEFKDVDKNEWYYSFIAGATAGNIIRGVSKDEFMPNAPITRQDIATILHRVLELKAIVLEEGIISFDDVADINEYSREAVAVFVKNNIISGYENNTFAPKGFATRAETAHLLYKILEFKW